MNIDLTTHYGGLTLPSPIIIGACPLTTNELTRISLINSGAGAIVLPSLFEEQVQTWNQETNLDSSSGTDFPPPSPDAAHCDTNLTGNQYLNLVQQAASSVSIPVIASLNGECTGHWLDFALQLEVAGASAIEFNLRRRSPHAYKDSHEAEDEIVNAASKIKKNISIPLFLKLGRHYTSLSHLAGRLLKMADGLILFGNAPEVDISMETLQAETRWGLTEPGSIARSIEPIMRVHSFCPQMPLAASGGIGSADDIPKVLLAGADVAMITSAVYRDGPEVIAVWLDSLKQFMQHHEMSSLAELKARCPNCFDDEEDRTAYIKALSTPPTPNAIRSADRILHCDRWGHVTGE